MGPVAYSSTPFAPVVDGDVLPSAPWAALADGASRDVELLIGHSRDEYSLLAAQLPDIDEAQVDVLIDGLSPTPGAHRYRAAYPSATAKQLRETALSDWLYRMPALHLAEAADHHPDLDVRYNRVRIGLSTHSEGGITAKDLEARGITSIDQLFRGESTTRVFMDYDKARRWVETGQP